MRKLLAGFILIMALPMVSKAQTPDQVPGPPDQVPRPEMAPSPSSETLPSAPNPQNTPSVDTQSEAYTLCQQATQRFDQQERAKGNRKVEITSLSTACEEELKPAAYWRCMDQKAREEVDFNTADSLCKAK